MRCPKCGGRTKVKDSRIRKEKVTRKRECKRCGAKFKTFERLFGVVVTLEKYETA